MSLSGDIQTFGKFTPSSLLSMHSELICLVLSLIMAEVLDFNETDLLLTNLLMVGTMSNNSYTTVDSQMRTSLKQH